MQVSSKIKDRIYTDKINRLPYDVQQSIHNNALKYRKLQKELSQIDPYKVVFTLTLKDEATTSFHEYGIRVFQNLNTLEWNTLLFSQLLGFSIETIKALLAEQAPIRTKS
jgi:hypothetical protein